MLQLSDVIHKTGVDPKEILLIRHPLSNARFRRCYEKGFLYEYTCHQKEGFSNGFRYWMVFVGDSGTTALLKGFYRVLGSMPSEQATCPDGYPWPDDYEKGHAIYRLEELSILSELTDRLLIDWGSGTRSWHQSACRDKDIVALQQYRRHAFPGYEKLLLSYQELKDIVDDRFCYADWHAALSAVSAVYLIADRTSGKQYVGSAYGAQGLLGRWRCYAQTGHGHDKQMIDMLQAAPEQYVNFQFSILQILPKSTPPESVIEMENLYKDKLLTRGPFGWNSN